MSNGTLVYSTRSGAGTIYSSPEVSSYHPRKILVEEFCFICGRPTDHSGEHSGSITVESEQIYADTVVYVSYVKYPEE